MENKRQKAVKLLQAQMSILEMVLILIFWSFFVEIRLWILTHKIAFKKVEKLETELENIELGDVIVDQKELMQKIEKHFKEKGGFK